MVQELCPGNKIGSFSSVVSLFAFLYCLRYSEKEKILSIFPHLKALRFHLESAFSLFALLYCLRYSEREKILTIFPHLKSLRLHIESAFSIFARLVDSILRVIQRKKILPIFPFLKLLPFHVESTSNKGDFSKNQRFHASQTIFLRIWKYIVFV